MDDRQSEKKEKFSVAHFFIKITSRQFMVWIVTTIITTKLLFKNGEHSWFLPLIIVWGIISVLFLGGNVLIDALAKMVEKANLTINQNNSISANTQISGNIGGQK